jgi:hypothetical protein
LRYYLATSFNGMGGYLMSLALVREDGRSLYWVETTGREVLDQWVEENVFTVLMAYPVDAQAIASSFMPCGMAIAGFMRADPDPLVIADWPIDFAYFCSCLLTGADTMVPLPKLEMKLERCESWPNTVENAVRHNSWWDAFCLFAHLEPDNPAVKQVHIPLPAPGGGTWDEARANYPGEKAMALRDPDAKTH